MTLHLYTLTAIISFNQQVVCKRYQSSINISFFKDWQVYKKAH